MLSGFVVSLLLLILWFWLVFVRVQRPVVSVEGESRRRTARRDGAAYAVDLRRRRLWFADDNGYYYTTEDGEKVPVDISEVDPSVQQLVKYQMQQIKQLNNESAGRRHEITDLRSRLDAMENNQREQLEQQGNYKGLYDKTLQENTQLKLSAERADRLEQQIKTANEAKLAQIPDDWKAIVPDLAPDKLAVWLDSNMSRFTTPKAPDLNAGDSTGGGKTNNKLTPDQEAAFKLGGWESKEQYLEYVNKRG